MINLDTRLLDLVPLTINANDFFVLLCIAKRINSNNTSYPSRMTLMKESGFGKDKVSGCITNLVNAGIIERVQRAPANKQGKLLFSSNLYKIKTDYLSVFVNLKDKTVEANIGEEVSEAGFPDTEIQDPENQPLSINHSFGSINQDCEGALATAIDKILKAVPQLTGHPALRSISEVLSNKPAEYIDWVLANKDNIQALSKPVAWDKWFWEDYHTAKLPAPKAVKTTYTKSHEKPYYAEFSTRREYEQAMEAGGFPHEDLPPSAARHWGEEEMSVSQRYGVNIKTVDGSCIDEDQRKNELYKQTEKVNYEL